MGNCGSRSDEDNDLSNINYQEEMRFFYVVTVIFNPARSKTSIKLYNRFKRQVENAGVRLITVEVAFENSPFSVTSPNYEPFNIQFRTRTPIFQKERFINLAMNELPLDAKYVAWCDYEVEFLNSNWVFDTIQALHVFRATQLFEELSILGPGGEEIRREDGFIAKNFKRKEEIQEGNKEDYMREVDDEDFENSTLAAGFGWGYRVDAWRDLEGLLDWCPLGNADKLMGYCLTGRSEEYIPKEVDSRVRDWAKDWQKKAKKVFKDGIGHIPGTVKASWTSMKRDKRAYEKWDLLVENEFDPKKDLIPDDNGIYTLNSEKNKLSEDFREFFSNVNGEMIE